MGHMHPWDPAASMGTRAPKGPHSSPGSPLITGAAALIARCGYGNEFTFPEMGGDKDVGMGMEQGLLSEPLCLLPRLAPCRQLSSSHKNPKIRLIHSIWVQLIPSHWLRDLHRPRAPISAALLVWGGTVGMGLTKCFLNWKSCNEAGKLRQGN